MKNYILYVILSAFIISCGQSKAKQQQEAINDMMEKYGDDKDNKLSDENIKKYKYPDLKAPSAEVINSGLMGEWKCVLVTWDSNTNGILDPEEKEKGFTDYSDYLKLNPDGTCEYSDAHLQASYEVVEKDGNKSIVIVVGDGTRMNQGRIISLKPDELQLMKFSGGRDIVVFNRL